LVTSAKMMWLLGCSVGSSAVRDERDVVARVAAHDLGGAGGPVEALDAQRRRMREERRHVKNRNMG
jgi:hypothetical protein